MPADGPSQATASSLPQSQPYPQQQEAQGAQSAGAAPAQPPFPAPAQPFAAGSAQPPQPGYPATLYATNPYPAQPPLQEEPPKKLSRGAIVGIAAGGCVVAALLALFVITAGFGLMGHLASSFSTQQGQTQQPAEPEPPAGSAVETASAALDDGELHSGWDPKVGYTFAEESFDQEGAENAAAYGMRIFFDFDVAYPRLDGDIPNLDAVNQAIRDTAMRVPDRYYLNPTEDAVSALAATPLGKDSGYSGIPADCDALISSEVDYAITYNTDSFISIAFSDNYCIGSWYSEFVMLRCVNVNLETGEVYELESVLTVTEDIAEHWVDTFLAASDHGEFAIGLWGREEFVRTIMGQGTGDHNDRMSTTFFVDAEGNVNLGVTFAASDGQGSLVRSWWDAALPDDMLEAAKKESTLWDVLEQ